MVIIQGGTHANNNGNILEKFVEDRLIKEGYKYIKQSDFKASTYLEQPFYTKQYPLCKSIYDTQIKCDFLIFHPEKFKDFLVIECKWQQSGGSVDEKFPYLILNIQMKYPNACILLLDGGGYKKKAEEWVKKQTKNNLKHVFNMAEFTTWANKGHL